MSIIIFLVVLYVLNGFTMTKLFEKAGIPAYKAWIPGVAAVEWCKMVGRKPQFAFWLLFPVVNFFIYAGLCIDMIRSFGRHGFWQSVLAVVFAPIPFFQIGRSNETYQGPVLDQERDYHLKFAEAMEKKDEFAMKKLTKDSPFHKSVLREWTEAIIFAVFAAAFIRMFVFEAFVIPTPSMEGTLKVGDFLFVSKPSYGLRLPMTVLQFPLIHNRIGLLGTESYLEEPSLPYKRLPGWETLERNKPFVFNWPVGDSTVVTAERTFSYQQVQNSMPRAKVVTRPIDKKDHYIKRCVAVGGDSLVVRAGQLYINGEAAPNPEHLQFLYDITGKVNAKKLQEFGMIYPDPSLTTEMVFADATQVEKVRALGVKIERRQQRRDSVANNLYPHVRSINGGWNVDNYGPIYIPKAGATVQLDARSMAFYWRIIKVYEKNTLETRNGKYYINGVESNTYTFKQNYYWAMGDNRHNSEDSRMWGYVPEDHVVGKPVLVWFSTKNGAITNGINWDRLFLLPGNM
jgi:signal peptidase I